MSTDNFFELNHQEDHQIMLDAVSKWAQESFDATDLEVDAQTRQARKNELAAFELDTLAIPEDLDGGGGLDPVLLASLAQRLAQADFGLTVECLNRVNFFQILSADSSQHDRVKALIADSDQVVCVATPKSLDQCPVLSDGKLTGVSAATANAQQSQHAIIIAKEGDEFVACLVETGDIQRKEVVFMGAKTTTFASFLLEQSPILSKVNGFDINEHLARCQIAATAMSCGIAQAILDYDTAYCNERVAFGEPITHRQSVAFMLADIAIEQNALELMALKAASRLAYGGDYQHSARLAWLQAAKYGMKIGTDGVQLLGGAGFIKEHPVEKWYRDIRSTAIVPNLCAV